MILTSAILNEAAKWLDCKEVTNNRSACVDEIHELFQAGSAVSADSYCAKAVYVITDLACKKLGVPNPLYKSASTVTMLNNTKLRKDTTPAKGAVFYRKRYDKSGKLVGGHVGFVEDVSANKFNTIEGNTSTTDGKEGFSRKSYDINASAYTFIHLEDLDTIENNINSLLQPLEIQIGDKTFWTILSILGVGGLSYFACRRLR